MNLIRRFIFSVLMVPILLIAAHMFLFRWSPVPLTPLMVIRWNQDHPIEKDWVSIDEVSPHLARAVIASEDNRFCVHSGVDWSAVKAVFEEYRDEGRLRGASTISMQTVKNLYLWPGRSVVRKGLESGLVYVLEWAWSKERIMEVYLNIVEFGPGVYGAQAAAQHHFSIDAADLTLEQSAALASILPDPLHRDPTSRNNAMGIRIDRINKSLGELGPLLDCVAEPPIKASADKTTRESERMPSSTEMQPSKRSGAPQHFQPVTSKHENESAPNTTRPPNYKKSRSKRRRTAR